MKASKIIKKSIASLLLVSAIFDAAPVWALTKTENVFVNLDSYGKTNKVTITEHLGDVGNDKILDRSKLKNIKNINGDEKYTLDKEKIVWENKGNDIYYSGEYNDDNLPISIDVKYYLDDKESKIDDMLGKKGKVKIELNYINNLKHNALVNNKNVVLYTPFVVTTTSIINNTDNKNIKVTNGKVIDNGTSSIIVALATPGLYDSLDIDKLKNLDKITITYDTTNFSLSSIYSIASNKILDNEDVEVLEDVNKLYNSINTLVTSSKELVNGSDKILSGSKNLANGTNELLQGTSKVYNGSKKINDSVKESIDNLRKDTKNALDENTLNSIVKNSKDAANKELYNKKELIINSAIEEAKKATTLNEEQVKNIEESTILGIKNSDEYKDLENSYNNYVGLASEASNAYSQYMEAYQNYLSNGLEDEASEMLNNANEYKNKMEAATQAATTYKTMMVIMEETAKKTAISTASSVSSNVASQVAGTVASEIATQVTDNVAEKVSYTVASEVANSVKSTIINRTISSLTTLSNGLDSLTEGLKELNNGAKTLYDGTNSLYNGLNELNNGLRKFDEQGIGKISNIVNNVKGVQERLELLDKYGQEYETMDIKDDNTKGSSKLIMVIEEVKKEKQKKENVQTTKLEKKKSIWEKIKGLFK